MKLNLIFAALFLAVSSAAIAAVNTYTPDFGLFDGAATLALDPSPTLNITETGTIEFWVEPDWTEDPGYDPVIISNAGSAGASYLVALLRDRDGIGIMAGDRTEYAAYDFTDGKMHYVAICDYGLAIVVYIDGKLIARFDGMSFEDLPSSGVWIGSADGENAPFIGGIAGLRIWGYPVEIRDLLTYATADLNPDDGVQHPGLPYLKGISDFDNADFLIANPQ